jgi:hypothetical protein
MVEKNDLLDEDYDVKKDEGQKKNFNYTWYSFSYIFLMLTIGALVSKIMSGFDPAPYYLFIGSLVYICYGMIISLAFEGLRLINRKFISKKAPTKDIHPTWFRILETCFYAWCAIVFITYVGNKVI